MRIDTPTIQPIVTPAGAMPASALGARPARWIQIVATILATITAILLASGLAVVMNLS
jgi:hypothetical protein